MHFMLPLVQSGDASQVDHAAEDMAGLAQQAS